MKLTQTKLIKLIKEEISFLENLDTADAQISKVSQLRTELVKMVRSSQFIRGIDSAEAALVMDIFETIIDLAKGGSGASKLNMILDFAIKKSQTVKPEPQDGGPMPPPTGGGSSGPMGAAMAERKKRRGKKWK